VLQLGSELISSDPIALFELIKNASDAGAPEVDITVVWRLNGWPGDFPALIAAVQSGEKPFELLREKLLACRNVNGKNAAAWTDRVIEAKDAETICALAKRANYIRIEDKGHGMSFADLDRIYLTIGTPNRLIERQQGKENDRKIQGEKGLGRLSAMRLGDGLRVKTSRAGERHWNVLEIDWKRFTENMEELVEDVEVAPKRGETKEDATESGTRIRITDLKGHWTESKLRSYANESLNRITDPFSPKPLFRVNLRFNEEKIVADRLDTDLLKMAHAKIEAEFVVAGTAEAPRLKLRGLVDYNEGNIARVNPFVYEDLTHLAQAADVTPAVAWSLGPFTLKAYWFNRQALAKTPNGPEIVKWVNDWSGGLMLFRDGFRVHPYGAPDDDWLALDKKALASGGYKVNRKQLIGKVEISSRANAALTDQTNREGLRECPEKDAFVMLLKHVLEKELRAFMNSVAKEQQRDLEADVEALTKRAAAEREKLKNNFALLKRRYPEVSRERDIVAAIDGAIEELDAVLTRANEAADAAQAAREQLVHLAGLGLMVEMLAHELNRSTQFALGALSQARRGPTLPAQTDAPLSSLELQLKTLSKRLRTLDPATTSGRQRKETFDLVALVHEICAGHEGEFRRHCVTCVVTPKENVERFMVKMVKGMVVQVLENLLNNSLYWLKAHAKISDGFKPRIDLEVDSDAMELRITDNGPGVTESIKPRLFTPFFTTKPAGQGKGLGLFISRDIAKYHDCTLTLSDKHLVHRDRYNTFVLSLPAN